MISLFLFKPMEVLIEDESKLTLHGLSQYYVKLNDKDKNNKQFQLLDAFEFNQVYTYNLKHLFQIRNQNKIFKNR